VSGWSDAIGTERLRLRRARCDDLAAVHRILSDPRAMRYWSTLPHTELGQSEGWLADMIEAPPECADDFVVELGGRVVGKAGCWRLPEVGFIFHPEVWGLGIAQEALRAVLPRVFARFAVPALVADVDPRNAACLRLLERLGFRETGRLANTWQVGGVACGSVYLELPHPDRVRVRSSGMPHPETYLFGDDGRFPNSALPVLVYRRALAPDAGAMEAAFAGNGWSNAWRNGIFEYHHFHSTSHEVLGIAAGAVTVALGGPAGGEVVLRAGDVVVIPAGVGHRNLGGSDDLLVVGAYPGGRGYDVRRGRREEYAAAVRAIAAVPVPGADPVHGARGALTVLWAG
jgi:uncharacterized protein YjlB/RimJ/RimL family protein N-acetyltransferase